MNKKNILIDFADCPGNWDKRNNFITEILKEHYNVIISQKPQYLFYSVFSFGKYPENLKYDCIKIFFTGENICPDFNLCDYAIGFEYMEYGDRYLRFPNHANIFYHKKVNELMRIKHLNLDKVLAEKKKFCSFVYSNQWADPIRDKLFRTISRYKKVDSGGKWLNNIGKQDGVADKLEFEKLHKFSIACENSSHPGYTTEKLVQSFAAGTVPIYWGDPLIGKMFNEKAFINVHNYKSINEVVSKIIEVDTHANLYLEMLQQPAIINVENRYENYNVALQKFLLNIFEQPYKDAFRRNRVFKGMEYLRHHREAEIKAEKYRKIENKLDHIKLVKFIRSRLDI